MISAEQNQELRLQAQPYLLGYSEAEELRLRRQGAELRPESGWLFDRIGLAAGSCGRGSKALGQVWPSWVSLLSHGRTDGIASRPVQERGLIIAPSGSSVGLRRD